MKYVASVLAVNIMVFAACALPMVDDPYGLMGLAAGSQPAGITLSLDDLWPGLLGYMVSHAGVAHLAVNMIMLAVAGRGLEEKAGVRIIPIYLVGGVLGAITHLTYSAMFEPGISASLVGASAAVSAIFGAACVYRTVSVGGVLYFVFVLNLLPMVTVSVGIFPDSGVSYVSHVGGAVAGVVAGACFVIAGRVRRRVAPVRGCAVDPGWKSDIARTYGRQAVYS